MAVRPLTGLKNKHRNRQEAVDRIASGLGRIGELLLERKLRKEGREKEQAALDRQSTLDERVRRQQVRDNAREDRKEQTDREALSAGLQRQSRLDEEKRSNERFDRFVAGKQLDISQQNADANELLRQVQAKAAAGTPSGGGGDGGTGDKAFEATRRAILTENPLESLAVDILNENQLQGEDLGNPDPSIAEQMINSGLGSQSGEFRSMLFGLILKSNRPFVQDGKKAESVTGVDRDKAALLAQIMTDYIIANADAYGFPPLGQPPVEGKNFFQKAGDFMSRPLLTDPRLDDGAESEQFPISPPRAATKARERLNRPSR